MPLGPTCPACATRVPFLKTQWGLGTPFCCRGCEALLVVPRTNIVVHLALFAGIWLARDYIPSEWYRALGLFIVLAAIVLPLTWVGTRVRLANPG